MSYDAWIIIIGISGLNVSALIGGVVHLTNRLTKIETDLKWIVKNCDRCTDLKK